jgi:hypothetical protein
VADQQQRSANEEEGVSWRTCPICCSGNAASPKFKAFLPLMKHMAEHFVDWEEVPSADTGDVFLSPQRPPKQKFPPRAKLLLAMVADWLERALEGFPGINSITTSDLKVADQLVKLSASLPDRFAEQQKYLQKYEDKPRDTGMDPKWPRKLGRQIRFVAESMAGADWNLTPSVSREYIRESKTRKSAIPGVDQRWLKATLEGSTSEEE